MLVVLKIPIVYLAVVVWWAIRSEPRPEDEPRQGEALVPLAPCAWDDRREPPRSATDRLSSAQADPAILA